MNKEQTRNWIKSLEERYSHPKETLYVIINPKSTVKEKVQEIDNIFSGKTLKDDLEKVLDSLEVAFEDNEIDFQTKCVMQDRYKHLYRKMIRENAKQTTLLEYIKLNPLVL